MSSLKMFVAFVALAWSSISFGSGFGWYVSTVRWDRFKEDVGNLLAEAEDVISVSPQSEKLKQYFQDKLEEQIYNKYCNTQGREGNDLSPFFGEFYSVRFVNYAESFQRARNVKNSVFYLFAKHKPYVSISPKSIMGNLNPYFLLSPEEVDVAVNELREFNSTSNHPPEFAYPAKHMEGVLLIAANDRHPDNTSRLSVGMRTGLMFCGHD